MTKVPSRERPVYTLRLATSERLQLEAASAERGQYLAEFIRESALIAAQHLLTSDAVR